MVVCRKRIGRRRVRSAIGRSHANLHHLHPQTQQFLISLRHDYASAPFPRHTGRQRFLHKSKDGKRLDTQQLEDVLGHMVADGLKLLQRAGLLSLLLSLLQ